MALIIGRLLLRKVIRPTPKSEARLHTLVEEGAPLDAEELAYQVSQGRQPSGPMEDDGEDGDGRKGDGEVGEGDGDDHDAVVDVLPEPQ